MLLIPSTDQNISTTRSSFPSLQFSREAKRKAAGFPPSTAGELVSSLTLRRPLRRREGGGTRELGSPRVDSRASLLHAVVRVTAARAWWRIKSLQISPSRCCSSVRRRGSVDRCLPSVSRPDGIRFSSCGCRGGGGDHGVDFCSPASAPSRRRSLRRPREGCGFLYRSLRRKGGLELGLRRLVAGSGFLPRRRQVEKPALGGMELGDVPRPTRHNRHGLALRGGPQLRLLKPSCDGASMARRAARFVSLRRVLRRRRRSTAGDAAVGCKDLKGLCCIFLFSEVSFANVPGHLFLPGLSTVFCVCVLYFYA